MPTFAHVVAALLYGGLAWYVSDALIEPLFPEAFNPGWFAEVNAAVGVVCGWMIMGSRARLGFVGSISVGFTTILMTVFWALFIQSFNDMLGRSLEREYDGPAEAVIAVFELLAEHLRTMSTVEVWATLIAGGIVAGIISGMAGRAFR
ncbi:TrgA family protein [Roseisalinus antarcticus]|uniref:Tellurium resistance protein n=1 Tax=Roseisalinus antarcticus TaxID=254357 RepID=A0A1Y5TU93_9RHOB|nr:TrgA family protein [Roseisalinus antarcticus]SLN71865.1 hypothetical protein ROA7023_03555 [Roseisalinus antarcticus]